MKQNEFNAWLADFCLSFPEMTNWLNNCANKSATLERWRQVFVAKRIGIEAGKQATQAMLSGDASPPKAFEREHTAAMVVRACRELQLVTSSKSEQELAENVRVNPRKYERPSASKTIWQMAEQLTAMKKSGATKSEQDAWLDRADREAFPESYPRPDSLFEKYNNLGAF